ncbi:MAG: VWA domain-containing protein [Phycisphaerae bacterium]
MMDFLARTFAPGPFFGWLCVLFLPLIPLVWIRALPTPKRPAVRFSSIELLRQLGTTWAMRTRFIIPLLRSLAIAALIIALARPQSGGAYRDTSEGIAIQMVLDVSGSMAEKDFVIDGHRARRLDAVKKVFEDFVMGRGSLRGRDNDLIGMTTFAMYADTPCPLTLDHGSLRDLLEATEIPGWVDGRQVREELEAGNTSLGDAIVLATDVLRRAGEQAIAGVPGAEAAKSRVMILLTDGADNPPDFAKRTAPDPVEAAKIAASLGIKIYTIGAVGSESVSRRTPFGLFSAPRAQVDEPTLKEIANVTGGKYFRATDTRSLVAVYDEIDQLERHSTGERTFRDNVYACKVAVMGGLALLLVELLLINTRYRKLP